MVQEILKNINIRIQKQVNNIEKAKEAEILKLEKDYRDRLKEEKERKAMIFKQENLAQAEGFRQLKESNFNFKIQAEKNSAIEEAYQKAEEYILNLSAGEFLKIISKLVSLIPEGVEGDMEAGPKTAHVLKRVLGKAKISESPDEGFIIRTPHADYDFRISEYFSQLKEENDPRLLELLFA